MKNKKHLDTSTHSSLVTKSKRYWAGAKRNKPKHDTKKKDRGMVYWMRRCDAWDNFDEIFLRKLRTFPSDEIASLECIYSRSLIWQETSRIYR